MSDIYFVAKAAVVAQVAAASIDSLDGTPGDNDFTVTIGGVAVTVAGDTDVATTAAALLAALQAETHPYFTAVTWTNPSGGTITGTAVTAGVPFEAALSVSGVGSGAVTDFSDTTPNSGPNDWNAAANWSGGAKPANSDNVIIKDSAVNICYGLAQSGVTLSSLRIEKSYTGKLGLDYLNLANAADGSSANVEAVEYRATHLTIKVNGPVDLGAHNGIGVQNGSTRLLINLLDQETTVIVHDTARTSADNGRPALRIKCASATTSIFVKSAPGGVGVAMDAPHETSTVGLVSVSDTSTASRVFVGRGVTITTFFQNGGDNYLNAAATVTTVTAKGGKLLTEGDYTITTLNANGGAVNANNIKTAGNCVTTMNVAGGEVNFLGSNRPRTVAATNVDVSQSGSALKVDTAVVTLTAVQLTGGQGAVQAA